MGRQKRDLEEEARQLARWRREIVAKRRKHVPAVLARMQQHWTGAAPLTVESYRSHRSWLCNYFAFEEAQERDAVANLPHLTVVPPCEAEEQA